MRKVKYAKLHQNAHIPSLADLTNTLPPNKSTVAMDMTYTAEGILCVVKGPATPARPSGSASVLIPWANVVVAEVTDDLPEPAKAPADKK